MCAIIVCSDLADEQYTFRNSITSNGSDREPRESSRVVLKRNQQQKCL